VQGGVTAVAVPRRQLLAGAVAGVALVALEIVFRKPWQAPAFIAEPPYLELDLYVGPDEFSQPAISPDGMRVVFVSKRGLSIRHLDQPKTALLAGTEGASYPFFPLWAALQSRSATPRCPVAEPGVPTITSLPQWT
jgi:hypothetical protein